MDGEKIKDQVISKLQAWRDNREWLLIIAQLEENERDEAFYQGFFQALEIAKSVVCEIISEFLSKK